MRFGPKKVRLSGDPKSVPLIIPALSAGRASKLIATISIAACAGITLARGPKGFKFGAFRVLLWRKNDSTLVPSKVTIF
jgi:hypothetical protein